MKNGRWWKKQQLRVMALHYSLCPVVWPALCGLAALFEHRPPLQWRDQTRKRLAATAALRPGARALIFSLQCKGIRLCAASIALNFTVAHCDVPFDPNLALVGPYLPNH